MSDMVYGIRIHGHRWLAQSRPPAKNHKGWIKWRWTSSIEDAEKFDSVEDAMKELRTIPELFEHDDVKIRPIYPQYSGWTGGYA